MERICETDEFRAGDEKATMKEMNDDLIGMCETLFIGGRMIGSSLTKGSRELIRDSRR